MNPPTSTPIDAAATQAATAIETLNDLIDPGPTGRSGLSDLAQVQVVVGALTRLVEGLPPLLQHLGRWLEGEAVAGRLLVNGEPMAGATAGLTVGEDLEEALASAETLGEFLQDARDTLTTLTGT